MFLGKGEEIVQIRLIGTAEELALMLDHIREKYDVISISRLYPCRDDASRSRQYITVKEREQNEPIKEV